MKRKEKRKYLRENMACPCCDEERHVALDTPLLSMQEQFTNEWACQGEWAVDVAIKGRLRWACNRCLSQGRAIAAHPERQNVAAFPDSYPYLAYYDFTKHCSDCGSDFLFSAQEQRYWYEILKFPVVVDANQCRDCRRKRREHANYQREIQHAQQSLDERDPHQLYHLASLFLLSGAYPSAYEYLARARKRAKERGELTTLQDQFDGLKRQIQEAIQVKEENVVDTAE